MEDAREMLAASERSGKTYAVIQNRRYDKNIIRFRDVLKSGLAGKLTTLHSDFYIGAHFGGFREEMDHVLLLDMAIHSFDQARFISGKDPVSVVAHEWNPAGSWYSHGASAVCVFEMDDGVVFTYRGSWCAEGLNTTWECDWRAICENGSFRWDGAASLIGEGPAPNAEGQLRAQQKLEIPLAEELEHVSHAGVIREFLDCLESGETPQTVCSDNIKSLGMVHAAVESAETGRKIFLR
jgi:predicted dehydrogenase